MVQSLEACVCVCVLTGTLLLWLKVLFHCRNSGRFPGNENVSRNGFLIGPSSRFYCGVGARDLQVSQRNFLLFDCAVSSEHDKINIFLRWQHQH